jgi:hypothetical protein
MWATCGTTRRRASSAWREPAALCPYRTATIRPTQRQGKSVGFVRLKSHAPSSHEIAANADMAKVSRVIDEWLLIEYAVTFLLINQNALVEAVSKSAVKAEALSSSASACPADSLAPYRPYLHPSRSRRNAKSDKPSNAALPTLTSRGCQNERLQKGLSDSTGASSVPLTRHCRTGLP